MARIPDSEFQIPDFKFVSLWPWWSRSTAARAWPMSPGCARSPIASCRRAGRDTMSWLSCRRWATPPTNCWRWPSRCRRTRTAASSTCCSRRENASPWPCCRWPFASRAATPSASPAASPASSPTIGTWTRASSKCVRSGFRTSSRGERSWSSPATRASPTAAK